MSHLNHSLIWLKQWNKWENEFDADYKKEKRQKEHTKSVQPSLPSIDQQFHRRKEIFAGSQDLSSLFTTPRALPTESPLLTKIASTSVKNLKRGSQFHHRGSLQDIKLNFNNSKNMKNSESKHNKSKSKKIEISSALRNSNLDKYNNSPQLNLDIANMLTSQSAKKK